MLPDYDDIKSRIAEPPTWYDGNGTPRYGEFKPEMLGVYDDCAILVEIACQNCHERFLVGEGSYQMDRYSAQLRTAALKGTSAGDIKMLSAEEYLTRWAEHYSYGDPPAHGCVGDTMGSVEFRVVQAFLRNKDYSGGADREEWLRQPHLEKDIDPPEWWREFPDE